MSEIKDIIQKMCRDEIKNENWYSLPCKVIKIDEDDFTVVCEPLNGDAEIQDARIQTDLGIDNGLKIIPEINSNVMVTFINKNTGFISLYSDINSYKFVKNDISLEMNTDGVVFNGGNLDGLVVVGELVSKLNNLESDLNTLKSAFSSWTPVPNDGGSVLKGLTTNWSGQALTPTQQAEIENDKVKQ